MEIVIDARFCGPRESGNGGYTCGRLAQAVGGSAEVTLRAPPPLGVSLRVTRSGDTAQLHHGERLLAEARAAQPDLQPPPPPGWEAAGEAAGRYAGLKHHDFPHCFTCGPLRVPGDGLCVFTGPVDGDGLVAARWTPDASLADDAGRIRPEFLWAAIDCAGAWATNSRMANPSVLGRMTGGFRREVLAGEACIVTGWPLGVDGRKHHAGTALYTRAGELVGCSRQTWIELKPGS